jgi:hypothetical protein
MSKREISWRSRRFAPAIALLGIVALAAISIPAVGQGPTPLQPPPSVPNVSGAGGGLAAGLGSGTRSANPCAIYEPNTASCFNARGETETLGFGESHTWKFTCSSFNGGTSPYVATYEYSVDTQETHFTDPGIPLDLYEPNIDGKTWWLGYSITVTNWGSKHSFAAVVACF